MSTKPEAGSWADKTFGDDAADLRDAIVRALTDACTQSRDAQDVSRARDLDPFGHSLKTLQFQELADRIGSALPDRHRIEKLDRYSLVIVNNFVLYPIRSVNAKSAKAQEATVRKPVSKLRRQMFTALGPKPYQLPLASEWADEADAEDMRTLMTRLGRSTRLAAISYVCSFKAGLSDIYFGEAELELRDGALIFHDGEKLSVAPAPESTQRGLRTTDSGTGTSSRAFDGGELPRINLGANPPHQAPVTEPELPQPPASSNDEE